MTKSKDLELLLNGIRNRRSVSFMKGLFRTVNQLYRECIDRVHEKTIQDLPGSDAEEERPHVPTVTISQLKDSVGEGEVILTEIDIVSEVLEVVKLDIDASIRLNNESFTPVKEYEYLLTVSVAYAHSLLSVLIYPHRRLQQFLFALASQSRHFTTLNQLLNFHVLMDSSELLEGLESLESRYGAQIEWIALARLDMAMRMRKTDVVIDCLIKQNRSTEIVEYIRRFDANFDIKNLFSILEDRHVNIEVISEQIDLWTDVNRTQKCC